jgi:hypothetical protein
MGLKGMVVTMWIGFMWLRTITGGGGVAAAGGMADSCKHSNESLIPIKGMESLDYYQPVKKDSRAFLFDVHSQMSFLS